MTGADFTYAATASPNPARPRAEITGDHLNCLAVLARAVIVNRRGLRWFGDPVPTEIDTMASTPPDRAIQTATRLLYSYWYSVGRPVLAAELDALMRSAVHHNLTTVLESANPGRGRRSTGWRCIALMPDTVAVARDGLTVTASRSRVHPADHGSLGVGATVAVVTPSGSRNRSAGYYIAHSDEDLDYATNLSRLYINVSAEDAPRLVHAVCERLNAAWIPFDLKVASNAALYYRADVAVLYTPREGVTDVWKLVASVLSRRLDSLRPANPPLLHQLRPGVGIADDPASGGSFGTSRCHALATGLITASGLGPSERMQAMYESMTEQSIDAARPYLVAGHSDVYAGL